MMPLVPLNISVTKTRKQRFPSGTTIQLSEDSSNVTRVTRVVTSQVVSYLSYIMYWLPVAKIHNVKSTVGPHVLVLV